MVPWLHFDEILDRQQSYDLPRFKNEVLGLSTTMGDHVVTRDELEACCADRGMIQSHRDLSSQDRRRLVAGIDWGGGGTSRTVLVFGVMDEKFRFHILKIEKFRVTEDPNDVLAAVAKRCQEFQPQCLAADGGGFGTVYNRLLTSRLQRRDRLHAIIYSAADHEPRLEGELIKWTVNRSATIGVLFSRIKKQLITFPRVTECGSYLDEFSCVYAEYDSKLRSVKYAHPESQPDDALHATNYALLMATKAYHADRMY